MDEELYEEERYSESTEEAVSKTLDVMFTQEDMYEHLTVLRRKEIPARAILKTFSDVMFTIADELVEYEKLSKTKKNPKIKEMKSLHICNSVKMMGYIVDRLCHHLDNYSVSEKGLGREQGTAVAQGQIQQSVQIEAGGGLLKGIEQRLRRAWSGT